MKIDTIQDCANILEILVIFSGLIYALYRMESRISIQLDSNIVRDCRGVMLRVNAHISNVGLVDASMPRLRFRFENMFKRNEFGINVSGLAYNTFNNRAPIYENFKAFDMIDILRTIAPGETLTIPCDYYLTLKDADSIGSVDCYVCAPVSGRVSDFLSFLTSIRRSVYLRKVERYNVATIETVENPSFSSRVRSARLAVDLGGTNGESGRRE